MNEQPPDVFISWSGKPSQDVAHLLYDWLPTVIDGLKPWLSSVDIAAGARWREELERQLRGCKAGIFCLDHTNVASPWLNFEAGALAISPDTRVLPFLLGMRVSDLRGPIADFQVTTEDRDSVEKLLGSLSTLRHPTRPSAERLATIRTRLGVSWGSVRDGLQKIRERLVSMPLTTDPGGAAHKIGYELPAVEICKTAAEAYGKLQNWVTTHNVNSALLIQYSCQFSRSLIMSLLEKAKGSVKILTQDSAVLTRLGSEKQREATHDLPRKLRDDMGKAANLDVRLYNVPAALSAVLIDDAILMVGWYVYRAKLTEKVRERYPNDPFDLRGHDQPAFVVRSECAQFNLLKDVIFEHAAALCPSDEAAELK